MSEILLQTIVEKLEALEIALLKENNAGKNETIYQALLKEIKSAQSEITKLPVLLRADSKKINELTESIAALNIKLNISLKNQISHTHHLHKAVWICAGLFITSLIFLISWINCSNTKEKFEANDIKYRYLRVNGNTSLVKLLYHTDSLYDLNKDAFCKLVIQHEQQLAKQAELLRLLVEKKQEN